MGFYMTLSGVGIDPPREASISSKLSAIIDPAEKPPCFNFFL
jgi:hypothetical protein